MGNKLYILLLICGGAGSDIEPISFYRVGVIINRDHVKPGIDIHDVIEHYLEPDNVKILKDLLPNHIRELGQVVEVQDLFTICECNTIPEEVSKTHYSGEEVRKMFLTNVKNITQFWSTNQDNTTIELSAKQKCDGLAKSILSMIDLGVGFLPPLNVSLNTDNVDLPLSDKGFLNGTTITDRRRRMCDEYDEIV